MNSFALFTKLSLVSPTAFPARTKFSFFRFVSLFCHIFLSIFNGSTCCLNFGENQCFLREIACASINYTSFCKTRNPVFAFLLSLIENFLSEKTATVRKKRVYNGYQKSYAIWILNT